MQPLDNVRVLEFSTMVTAAFATMMMAEQGARVTKVEPPDQGDPMRYLGTAKGGMSALFANCNRGKRSIRIDLQRPEGQELAARLAADVDVLVHNFRPGVMDRLNLGSEQLRAENPRLIYVAISGFGKSGPLKDAPAYDPIIQAHAGFAACQGSGSPAFVRNLMCDKITAYTAAQAIVTALYQRERTGVGQHVDLSMLDAGLYFLFPDGFMNETLLDDDVLPAPRLADLAYELTVTRDGAIAISAGTPRQQLAVLSALGLEELLEDPRFATRESRLANREAYRALLAEAFAALSTEEALARLRQADVPAAKCLERTEVLDHPQLTANGSVDVVDHPHVGSMRVVRPPAEFGGARSPVAAPAPAHGEHTDEVLYALGLDAEQVAAHRANGVIA